MSDDEIHVPHHAHRQERGLAQWIAIFTALTATFGAIVGHEASETANEAILHKNDEDQMGSSLVIYILN